MDMQRVKVGMVRIESDSLKPTFETSNIPHPKLSCDLNKIWSEKSTEKSSSLKILQGRTGEVKMSGGPADLPTLLEEVRDMADRGGRVL